MAVLEAKIHRDIGRLPSRSGEPLNVSLSSAATSAKWNAADEFSRKPFNIPLVTETSPF